MLRIAQDPTRTPRSRRVVGGLLGAGVLAAGLIAEPLAASATPRTPSAGVVIAANDAVTGNQLFVYDRATNGTLQLEGNYSTGGLGGHLDGAAVDNLASQGSLVTDATHREVFAVNAGSNSVSVFRIHGDRLRERQVIPSRGSFPVSVAVDGSRVWVPNARDGGSLQGYVDLGGRLHPVAGWHRDLRLPAGSPEFTHTPGQVAFTPDGRHLIVTTKAASDSILVFGIGRFGQLQGQPAVRAEDGTVPFSASFDPGGHLAVAHAGPSEIDTYSVATDGTLTALDATTTGQPATCWITAAGQYLVVSNTGGDSLSTLSTSTDGSTAVVGSAATAGGPVDSAYVPNGGNLYVQTGATGQLDEFSLGSDGILASIGSVTVPNAVGGEGIVAW